MEQPQISIERIEKRIFFLRDERVMLSTDLAELYEVEPRVLVQAVKRNRDRFPEDFMFQLTKEEFDHLKSQIVTSSWGGIRAAQYAALKAVNKELVALYWDVGRMIVARQQDEKWGKSVVEKLAKDLREEFPGLSGYSARNLWYMRNFYATYSQSEKLQPLVAEIG